MNANPQSWNINPKSVAAVIDQLIDSMGCGSFRLMFDDCDWEEINDNDDPQQYNWSYYDSIYQRPRFAGIWDMVRYLNKRGINDITLSPDGAGPGWMGGTMLLAGKEKEYAESIASMVYYARKRLSPAVQFNKISPINETTCEGREGMITSPDQLKNVFSAVAGHLIADGVDDVTIIGPDDCGGWAANAEALLSDSLLMSRLEIFGQHDYDNSIRKAYGLVNLIKRSKYPEKKAIMTEVNAWCRDCDGGTYNTDYGFDAYAGPAYQYILQDLNVGVNGIQIWEAYDSRYHHPNRTLTWSMWGIFGVSDTLHPDVYTRRPHFDVMKHLYRFVKPGDYRIQLESNVPDLVISAFSDKDGKKLIVTGINNKKAALTLNFIVKGPAGKSGFECYITNAKDSFKKVKDVVPHQQKLTAVIPPKSVFTLYRPAE